MLDPKDLITPSTISELIVATLYWLEDLDNCAERLRLAADVLDKPDIATPQRLSLLIDDTLAEWECLEQSITVNLKRLKQKILND